MSHHDKSRPAATKVARVALVTAASRGIGAGIARRLHAEGWQLALLSPSGAPTVAAELGALGVSGSLARAEDLEAFVQAALARYGRIDTVVVNAGHVAKGDPLAPSDDDWLEGFAHLVLSVVRLCRLVTPGFLARGSGAVVAVTSFVAREPGLGRPVSAALRAAVAAFAKVYAEAYAGRGVRMNCVLPGYVDTYAQDAATIARIPAGRMGTADDIARAVAFLASDAASYVTGQSLLVDGGLVRGI